MSLTPEPEVFKKQAIKQAMDLLKTVGDETTMDSARNQLAEVLSSEEKMKVMIRFLSAMSMAEFYGAEISGLDLKKITPSFFDCARKIATSFYMKQLTTGEPRT